MPKFISFPGFVSSVERDDAGATNASAWVLGMRSYIMGTLNITPDSFSDGGLHNTVFTAVAYAENAVKNGADIIDVGGYSTRPGAAAVSAEEEIQRVVPIIKALRAANISVPISIDTFRASVASASVEAGANCINDVRALREPGFATVAKALGVPVIMMHSRGTDAGADKEYGPAGVMEGVRAELGLQVREALDAGVRKWNIIIDPGIGFSKSVAGNLDMIRDLAKFSGRGAGGTAQRASEGASFPGTLAAHVAAARRFNSNVMDQMPVLVGTSRKSYLGAILGKPKAPPVERDHATLAAVVASIQQGCDILRVHDVSGCRDAALVADALYRTV
jgi:dihydroneopterin aldolase/2-amino-4-hydroxy-6-hydroxymethyldihydropteridine diphosphokinase/dihydropteroate synthase